jgi:hypothetical protein
VGRDDGMNFDFFAGAKCKKSSATQESWGAAEYSEAFAHSLVDFVFFPFVQMYYPPIGGTSDLKLLSGPRFVLPKAGVSLRG